MAEIIDDEYVANLLKQDAKTAKTKYELVGIEAFNSKRLRSGAPKPNTNFLRHIIRQTDSHNAALLAKEAEESNARLKEMNRERTRARNNEEIRKERKADGRLTPVLSDEGESHARPTRRHNDHSQTHDRRHTRWARSADSRDRRHTSRDKEMRRKKRKREDNGEDHRHTHENVDEGRRSHRKHRTRRPRSRSPSSSRSRSAHSDRAERRSRRRDRSPSPKRASRHHTSARISRKEQKVSTKSKRRSPTPISDSDPLEAIVGPLPPNVQPSVRSRGRGAHKANSMGMDSRFSSTYDPTVDVRQASDAEDDWGEAVESFRDRQRWKQQGADRLKAAGFTDEQVKKWEKGDNKDEEDVTWTKRGQAREWDRGKVVDEDGDVDLKADWGRLK